MRHANQQLHAIVDEYKNREKLNCLWSIDSSLRVWTNLKFFKLQKMSLLSFRWTYNLPLKCRYFDGQTGKIDSIRGELGVCGRRIGTKRGVGKIGRRRQWLRFLRAGANTRRGKTENQSVFRSEKRDGGDEKQKLIIIIIIVTRSAKLSDFVRLA